MNKPLNEKTLVVGAGGGGIASALLASIRGEDVTLLEAHSVLGGCASWFRRGQFVFDAGATTLSGLSPNQPLGILFNKIGAWPEVLSCDPGIVFHLSNGKVIKYFQNQDSWIKELESKFPGLNHRPFWDLVWRINDSSWNLLKDMDRFPFHGLSDLISFFKYPQYVKLVPYLFLSTDLILKKFNLDTPEYQEMINGILLISAQAESVSIPFIVGAMALAYPASTYAPRGGMKGLNDFFENQLLKNKVKILKKKRVSSFESGKVIFPNGDSLNGDKIILNIPVWNQADLSTGTGNESFKKDAFRHPGYWGALTIYFGAKSNFNELYHQVHLNDPLVKNYFVSFSIPDDANRAPIGFQSVSISTHVEATSKLNKEVMSQIILKDFSKRFGISDFKFLNIGTPSTFEKFTGRKSGFVGGLPFLLGNNPFTILSPVTSEKGIFRVGDTVFPGQGLCGVVAGALLLDKRLV